jgi:RHS repeat-associated protein
LTGAKNGMLKDVTDVLSRKVQFEYNDYGNLTKQIDNLGNTSQFAYDGASRLIESIDAKDNKSYNSYNNYDQLLKLVNPLNDEVNYTYDANGNLIKVTDPKGNSTTKTYNNKDQLTDVTNQLNQNVHFRYNLNNVVDTITKPNGESIIYTFWDDGKLKTKKWTNYSAQFEYDNVSNLTKVTDNNGTVEFTAFDDLNRLVSTKDCWNNVVSYTYDENSNIKSIVYPGNKTVLYDYFEDNAIKSVKDWNNRETKYFYNIDGSLDSIWNQNGTSTKYKYDISGRLTEIANKKSNGGIINSYLYTLDNLGNHISVNKNEPIKAPIPFSEVTNYQYNAANRITNAGSKEYTYDYNGNLNIENNSGVQANYSFNTANQLLGISGSKPAQYLYDGLGNRIQTIKNSVTRKYIHDMNSSLNNLLMETDENGNVLNYYVYGIGLISRIKADGTTNYYHYDSRGSTVAMTNSNEEITHKYSYGSYGEILSKTEADNNPFRYVGTYGVIDDDNGLYYMRARYYDPSIGRFISEDPIWNVNLYGYAGGNPVMGIDPKGEWSIGIDGNPPRHEEMTRESLIGSSFTSAEIEEIVEGNREADLKYGATQSTDNYNRHAIRKAFQSRDDAIQEWQKIIYDEYYLYKTTGDLKALGRATHSIQDATNPGHNFTRGAWEWNQYLIKHKDLDNLGSDSPEYADAVKRSKLSIYTFIKGKNIYLQKCAAK